MEPTLIESGPKYLVGFSFFGDPFARSAGWTEENEIGRLWQRFMTHLAQSPCPIGRVKAEGVMYELHVYHAETPRTGEFEVFVGVEVEALEAIAVELSAKILPPATYAVFTLHGEQITSDWARLIYTDWAPGAGYAVVQTHSLQRYDARFKGMAQIADSALEVYIPVRKLDTLPQGQPAGG